MSSPQPPLIPDAPSHDGPPPSPPLKPHCVPLTASESDSGIEILPESQLDPRTDIIEQIFQKVEEESERRAREEQDRSRPGTANSPGSSSATQPATSANGRDPARDRRRGSISVSRFGQTNDLSSGTLDNLSTLSSRKNSQIFKVANTGAFYQAQKHSGSADSFASHNDDVPAHEEAHDEEQVTQMETIAGRPSLGKAVGRTIARRLSRARTRSRDILTVSSGLVIGVSVEEATVEAEQQNGGDGDVPTTPNGTVFVYRAEAPGTRSRRSTVSMPTPPLTVANIPSSVTAPATPVAEKRLSTASWVTLKAKDLTKIFKRKSMGVIPQNSSP